MERFEGSFFKGVLYGTGARLYVRSVNGWEPIASGAPASVFALARDLDREEVEARAVEAISPGFARYSSARIAAAGLADL